jgi:MFS family permease
VFRLGVGAMEANSPAAISLLSDYWPPSVRANKMGLYQAGALVGALVGLLVGGIVVSVGGWRWAFVMWIPLGFVATIFVARQPEPPRGQQDHIWDAPDPVDITTGAVRPSRLPPPRRQPGCDYATASSWEIVRELMRIRSMWFAVMALTISQLLLSGLQFWAVPYFERVDHLGAAGAGAASAALGLGAVAGILGGGYASDRLLERGILNARVFVVAAGSILATVVLVPAFASTHLWVTAPLLLVGGMFLTLPVAPAEAVATDVVVGALRGRAAAVRAIVRSLSSAGPLVIGALSTAFIGRLALSRADGLRWAIVAISPVYAVGGVIMLLAARHYPSDVSFVIDYATREEGGGAR